MASLVFGGCSEVDVDHLMNVKKLEKKNPNPALLNTYYNQFYKTVTERASIRKGRTKMAALEDLPKDTEGQVNWTTSVVEGFINPRPSLDPKAVDDPPLNLNIFIEAKVPLMANVIFPHSIHTYWLKCSNCHPNIFLPEAGANPISMAEIFKGKWCGRCHNKVAFAFWPRANCVRCHIILKGQSLKKEQWR